jgi:transposase
MIRPAPEMTVYLCAEPVDMRKQAATLALLVEQSLGRPVFNAAVYGFSNRRRDRIKLLVWERNGLVLWSKRLEGKERFVWPTATDGERDLGLSGAQLNRLLDGFDIFARGHREVHLRRVG